MEKIYLLIKGFAIGAVDIVPGVSGGTIAFILGLYERLLSAIGKCNLQALKMLFKGQFKALWQHVDGGFLLCLLIGILSGVFTLAGIITYFLENNPVPTWALFNGLILAALPTLFKSLTWNMLRVVLCLIGIVFAVTIGMFSANEVEPAYWMFFVAGAIAICAMLLPGISGSFMLILMGMYQPILKAVNELQLGIVFIFALGCVVGMLSFSRFLSWLLKHYHDGTLALFFGVILGAFYTIWPWKDGENRYSPWQYAEQVTAANGDTFIASSLLFLAIGIGIMLVLLNLEKWLAPSSSVDKTTKS